MASDVQRASEALADARSRLKTAEQVASPHVARIESAEENVRQAERDASIERLRERLDRLALEPPARRIERGLGIEL